MTGGDSPTSELDSPSWQLLATPAPLVPLLFAPDSPQRTPQHAATPSSPVAPPSDRLAGRVPTAGSPRAARFEVRSAAQPARSTHAAPLWPLPCAFAPRAPRLSSCLPAAATPAALGTCPSRGRLLLAAASGRLLGAMPVAMNRTLGQRTIAHGGHPGGADAAEVELRRAWQLACAQPAARGSPPARWGAQHGLSPRPSASMQHRCCMSRAATTPLGESTHVATGNMLCTPGTGDADDDAGTRARKAGSSRSPRRISVARKRPLAVLDSNARGDLTDGSQPVAAVKRRDDAGVQRLHACVQRTTRNQSPAKSAPAGPRAAASTGHTATGGGPVHDTLATGRIQLSGATVLPRSL